MNRRAFLKFLGIGTATAAVGIDLLEFLVPERTYFLPPTAGWVIRPGNQLLTPIEITNLALQSLEKELVFAYGPHREYDANFSRHNTNTGDIINIRRPPQYGLSLRS